MRSDIGRTFSAGQLLNCRYYIRVGSALADHDYRSMPLFDLNDIFPDPDKSQQIETLINKKYNMPQEETINENSMDIKMKMAT